MPDPTQGIEYSVVPFTPSGTLARRGKGTQKEANAVAQKERRAGESTQHRFQYAAKFLCASNIPDTSQTTPSLDFR